MKGYVKWWTLALVAFFVVGCANEPAPQPQVVKPMVVEPVKRVEVGNGRYLVGTQTVGDVVPMPPGTYQTNGLGDWFEYPNNGPCTWSKASYPSEAFIDAGFVSGVTKVVVSAGQQFEVRGGCTWIQQ